MTDIMIRSLRGGVNQSGVRNYNERLLLSTIQRNGPMPGSELAKHAGLSPQTVSVILRQLEKEGLLVRGAPVKGKVGKPSVPMDLAPEGAFSFGLKIGRRSADLVLTDFCGGIRSLRRQTYAYPTPDAVFSFLESALRELMETLSPAERARIAGLGVATPFELWNWYELLNAPAAEFEKWKDLDFAARIAEFSDLPVFIENDATAACRAEHVFGRGKEFSYYAYFYIGSFIGGGVVLNDAVAPGPRGYSGAFGPLRGADGRPLIDTASLYLLEADVIAAGRDAAFMRDDTADWMAHEDLVLPWIERTARALAPACLNICAVIDFEAILIDGAMPAEVRRLLVEAVLRHMAPLDKRGLIEPEIHEGRLGSLARARGGACHPVFERFFLDTNSGITAV